MNYLLKKNLELWLYIVAIGHILVGLALPLLAFSSVFDFYAEKIQATFWAGAFVPPLLEAGSQQGCGVPNGIPLAGARGDWEGFKPCVI